MVAFILRRALLAIPTLIFISFIAFVIIQLPPGDYVSAYAAELRRAGDYISAAQEEVMRQQMGLNDPLLTQYWRSITAIVLRGDFGYSLDWNAPVSTLIWDRLALTLAISTASLVITWLIAIPVGVYSATRQYSVLDYVFTVFGFLGKGTPDFLLALILMWISFIYLQLDVGGLLSPQYQNAPWSLDPARAVFRRHHHRRGAQPADHRPAAAAGAQDAGHVPGGQLHPHPQRLHRHRDADLRYPAGVVRPAHPLRVKVVP